MAWNNYWQLLAGLGIFLFGMFQLEEALKQLAGRKFKLFLQKSTNNKYTAILSGALITGMLQSSSVVSLMVLSFVGAGVIGMQSALGVIFGANLGSTFTNWIIATIGFKFNIEDFSFPIIAIAGLGTIFFVNYKNLHATSKFFMGFGLLFLGLGFMKDAFDVFVKNFDFTAFGDLNVITLVVIGFSITALIQASSATMVLTLSALSSGVITFEMAVAVIIGSELGTTVKILIGAIGGNAAKKQVAFGNIFFNFVTVIVSLILLTPIIRLVLSITGTGEPLIALVLFQSVINFTAILLFLPFIGAFGKMLEKMYAKNGHRATAFLQNTSPSVPVVAIEVMQKETQLFLKRVIHLNRAAFKIADTLGHDGDTYYQIIKADDALHRTYSEKYEHVKQAEGEMLAFYHKMSDQKMAKEDFERMTQLMASIRNGMYASKCIKDIRHDKNELKESALDSKFNHYKLIQKQLKHFFQLIEQIPLLDQQAKRIEALLNATEDCKKDYDERMQHIYHDSENAVLTEVEIATLLNLNREIYASCKALVFAFRDFLLDQKGADNFDNTPVKMVR